MPSLGVCACVIWLIAAFIAPSLAQTNSLFQWSFANTNLGTSIPTCYGLQIIVESFNTTTNDTIGTPPYYMIAFVVGETPVTTFIGTDANNLTWTVTEPVGSQLVLSVVDANGSAGGIQPRVFTVNDGGSTTQCVTTPTLTPAFTITSNVTGDLKTCQPWGLAVNGGVPPYTVTVAAVGSPVVMNFTMPLGDDGFTFINRAAPNGQLIGAVSDQTGRWATGTQMVNTEGSSDASCPGFINSSGIATLAQQDAGGTMKRHSVAIGVSVAFVVILLIVLAIGAVIYLRRRRQRQNQEFLAATMPGQFVEVEAQLPSVPTDPSSSMYQTAYTSMGGTAVTQPPESRYRNPPSPDNPSSTGLSYYPSIFTSDGQTGTTNRRSLASTRVSRAGFSSFPSSSIRRSSKSIDAGIHSAISPDSEYISETAISDSSDVLGRHLSAISSSRTRIIGRTFRSEGRVDEEPATIDQHQDARSINEPPPPYADINESI